MVLKSICDCLKAVPQKKFPVEIKYANVASYMLHTVNEEGLTVTFPLPVILDQ